MIKNITFNPGLLPINLGAAKLQQSSHTFVHYYDIEPIESEFNNLNQQHEKLTRMVSSELSYTTEMGNYDKVVKYLQEKINDKLSSVYYTQPKRSKRGLFNGLGTIAKAITGNLDDNDGIHFDKIIGQLQNNQDNIEKQIKMQYTINKDIILEFNNTVKNIAHNEQLINNRISELVDIIEDDFETSETLVTKDLFNQLIILYSTILNILQEIENSLTFCHLKTYHPSILSISDLYKELEKVSEHYGRQLPLELKLENMPNFQRLLSVDCKIESKRIIYFISIPINFDIDFELCYLLPIPSKTQEGYVTILPNNKYFLKSNNLVKSLDNPCIRGSVYQCPTQALNNNADECEIKLLQNEDTKLCQYINLEIPHNHLEIIPEINQILVVFPQEDVVKFQCPNDVENKRIDGIFLIEQNECNVIYKNEKVEFEQKSFGKPLFIDNLNVANFNITLPKSKIVLRNLKLNEITLNQLQPLEVETGIVHNIIIVSSFFSSFTLIGYILFLSLRKFKSLRSAQNPIIEEASKAYPDM